jgi:SAM-dependent methyltransferase
MQLPDEAAALDALLEPAEHRKWQRFYDDRQRASPFFVDVPDEILVRWVESGLVPRGAAIDLGCGQGRNAVYLARQGWQVQAVDLSASAVAWERERVAACGVPVAVTQCSVFELPATIGPFDFAYDGGCFHHLSPHRRRPYVDLVADLVRPGGCFGLVCFRPEGGSGCSDAEVHDSAVVSSGRCWRASAEAAVGRLARSMKRAGSAGPVGPDRTASDDEDPRSRSAGRMTAAGADCASTESRGRAVQALWLRPAQTARHLSPDGCCPGLSTAVRH